MDNATVNYGGSPRAINATVNHPDVTKGMAKQKAVAGKAIAEHASLMRHKNGKGTRAVKHTISEEIHKDGLTERQKIIVNTTRRNH